MPNCTSTIKDNFGLKIECGAVLTGSSCPNRKNHLTSYKTGFCGIGCCEGTAPKSPSGVAVKTCSFWQTCSCTCHEAYDQMFQIAKKERFLVDNSGYSPVPHALWMPTFENRIVEMRASTATVDAPLRIQESEAPDIVPPTVLHDYTPTPSGRSPKGELEDWTKEVCDQWAVDQMIRPCTPQYISDEIGKKQGILPPSTGAISAVFDRWILYGFAEIARKPFRFIKYTDDGIKYTLEGCRERYRRSKKVSRY